MWVDCGASYLMPLHLLILGVPFDSSRWNDNVCSVCNFGFFSRWDFRHLRVRVPTRIRLTCHGVIHAGSSPPRTTHEGVELPLQVDEQEPFGDTWWSDVEGGGCQSFFGVSREGEGSKSKRVSKVVYPLIFKMRYTSPTWGRWSLRNVSSKVDVIFNRILCTTDDSLLFTQKCVMKLLTWVGIDQMSVVPTPISLCLLCVDDALTCKLIMRMGRTASHTHEKFVWCREFINRAKHSISDGYDSEQKEKLCLQQLNKASMGLDKRRYYAI